MCSRKTSSNGCSSISEARKIYEANPEATHRPSNNRLFFKTGFSESGVEWGSTDAEWAKSDEYGLLHNRPNVIRPFRRMALPTPPSSRLANCL